MSNRVYSLLLTVCGNYSDEDIKLKSLTGFGKFLIYYIVCTYFMFNLPFRIVVY